jgi:hypothetical protein
MSSPRATQLVPTERIEKLILLLRGEMVRLGQHQTLLQPSRKLRWISDGYEDNLRAAETSL